LFLARPADHGCLYCAACHCYPVLGPPNPGRPRANCVLVLHGALFGRDCWGILWGASAQVRPAASGVSAPFPLRQVLKSGGLSLAPTQLLWVITRLPLQRSDVSFRRVRTWSAAARYGVRHLRQLHTLALAAPLIRQRPRGLLAGPTAIIRQAPAARHR
jgi:hypothetical protein